MGHPAVPLQIEILREAKTHLSRKARQMGHPEKQRQRRPPPSASLGTSSGGRCKGKGASEGADYSVWPLQALCGQVQLTSAIFSMASHSVLQYFPSVTSQVQIGCAHFLGAIVSAPWVGFLASAPKTKRLYTRFRCDFVLTSPRDKPKRDPSSAAQNKKRAASLGMTPKDNVSVRRRARHAVPLRGERRVEYCARRSKCEEGFFVRCGGLRMTTLRGLTRRIGAEGGTSEHRKRAQRAAPLRRER